MSKKINIVFIGRETYKYDLKSGIREAFKKDIPKEVDIEDGEKLLELRGRGCRCHNAEGRLLFITYDQWKEYYK